MEYISQTIASAELSGIFEIPPLLRNRKVQVIILPAEDIETEQLKEKKSIESMFGCMKGKMCVPDNFDEPLDDFKEYM